MNGSITPSAGVRKWWTVADRRFHAIVAVTAFLRAEFGRSLSTSPLLGRVAMLTGA